MCNKCIGSAGSTSLPNFKYSKLVQLRCYRKNTLFFVNEKTFLFFIEMEKVIRLYLPKIENLNINVNNYFNKKIKNMTCSNLKHCHNLLSKIKS